MHLAIIGIRIILSQLLSEYDTLVSHNSEEFVSTLTQTPSPDKRRMVHGIVSAIYG